MEKVASHINEMQKIYEDYGSVFDQLAAEQNGPLRPVPAGSDEDHQLVEEDSRSDTPLFFFLHPRASQVTEISMGDFLVHSSVVWLNPPAALGRIRKDLELTLFGGYRCSGSHTGGAFRC